MVTSGVDGLVVEDALVLTSLDSLYKVLTFGLQLPGSVLSVSLSISLSLFLSLSLSLFPLLFSLSPPSAFPSSSSSPSSAPSPSRPLQRLGKALPRHSVRCTEEHRHSVRCTEEHTRNALGTHRGKSPASPHCALYLNHIFIYTCTYIYIYMHIYIYMYIYVYISSWAIVDTRRRGPISFGMCS